MYISKHTGALQTSDIREHPFFLIRRSEKAAVSFVLKFTSAGDKVAPHHHPHPHPRGLL